MPINCLINCPINSVQFVFNSWTIRVPKQINGFLMNQFMHINVSKRFSKRVRSQQEQFLHECPFIVSLISEQFVNNSCSIRVPGNNLYSKQNQFVPPPKKCKPPWWPHSWAFLERKEEGARRKNNNFERFFADSTLTFLTSGNTYRLPILPSRRAVLLCLPLI